MSADLPDNWAERPDTWMGGEGEAAESSYLQKGPKAKLRKSWFPTEEDEPAEEKQDEAAAISEVDEASEEEEDDDDDEEAERRRESAAWAERVMAQQQRAQIMADHKKAEEEAAQEEDMELEEASEEEESEEDEEESERRRAYEAWAARVMAQQQRAQIMAEHKKAEEKEEAATTEEAQDETDMKEEETVDEDEEAEKERAAQEWAERVAAQQKKAAEEAEAKKRTAELAEERKVERLREAERFAAQQKQKKAEEEAQAKKIAKMAEEDAARKLVDEKVAAQKKKAEEQALAKGSAEAEAARKRAAAERAAKEAQRQRAAEEAKRAKEPEEYPVEFHGDAEEDTEATDEPSAEVPRRVYVVPVKTVVMEDNTSVTASMGDSIHEFNDVSAHSATSAPRRASYIELMREATAKGESFMDIQLKQTENSVPMKTAYDIKQEEAFLDAQKTKASGAPEPRRASLFGTLMKQASVRQESFVDVKLKQSEHSTREEPTAPSVPEFCGVRLKEARPVEEPAPTSKRASFMELMKQASVKGESFVGKDMLKPKGQSSAVKTNKLAAQGGAVKTNKPAAQEEEFAEEKIAYNPRRASIVDGVLVKPSEKDESLTGGAKQNLRKSEVKSARMPSVTELKNKSTEKPKKKTHRDSCIIVQHEGGAYVVDTKVRNEAKKRWGKVRSVVGKGGKALIG